VDSSQLEEERRLMYVAITRAKTELYISRAHERYTFGNYSANPKSRFIKEIPAEYLEVESNRGSAQSIFGSGAGGFSTFQSSFLKGAGEEERRD
jgi:DNA helicase II / ATP-dependent DNA helicase PcrA